MKVPVDPRRDVLAIVIAAVIVTFGLFQIADAILELQKTLGS